MSTLPVSLPCGIGATMIAFLGSVDFKSAIALVLIGAVAAYFAQRAARCKNK